MKLRFFAAPVVLGSVSCWIYTPDLEEDTGAGGAASTAVTTATGATTSTSASTATSTAATTVASTGSGPGVCANKELDGSETDVDCGGAECEPCDDDLKCVLEADCKSGVCKGTCQSPTCDDLVKNGGEPDIDCGASCQANCPEGKGCAIADDCQSGVCTNSICQPPSCGDGKINGGEVCDDGNTNGYDACSSTCRLPVGHLLLTEFVVTPDLSEFVEIYNPTKAPVELTNYWIADYGTYYAVTSGAMPVSTDFAARFPFGKMLAPGAFATISLHSATDFKTAYGAFPTYDFSTADMNAPTMSGNLGSQAGLTNSGEMLMLFYFDGVSNTVKDVDYVTYGASGDKTDKSSVAGYKPETPAASQTPTGAPASGKSMHRCPISEDGETMSLGNGLTGHDETSENSLTSWKLQTTPTPGAPPGTGVCL